jgi:frataxin-like iron-binding protein CyaY
MVATHTNKHKQQVNKMTIASEMRERITDINELICEAEMMCIDSDQDWDNEVTTFAFEDNSKLVINNDDVAICEDGQS